MYLSLTDEQRFLRDAATGALDRHPTLAAARAALEGEAVPSLWPVAVEAGWPGLLIGEDADGAALGAYEALLVLEACGRVLADARLLGHLPATALLEAGNADPALRAELAAGERRAALVEGTALAVRRSPAGIVLSGSVAAVLDAADSGTLVVVGRDADRRPAVAVVDGDSPGIDIDTQRAYDGTRSLAEVRLTDVVAQPLDVPADRVTVGRDLQRALLAAESVGAADACLAMARDYAVDRMAFGRPIGSYQAIKHKLVEMLRRIEGARSLLVFAGRSWEDDPAAFALAANAARVAATDALDYAAPENIFVHGGVGATWEHDASLYYRRAELSRRLAGGTDAAAEIVAAELLG